MRTIRDLKAKGKRVLVRVDFNLPLDKGGVILDDFRVRSALPTIKYLRDLEAKVILISHLGKPNGMRDPKLSLKKIAPILRDCLGSKVTFLSECMGDEVEKEVNSMKPGEVFLLENLRFHKGEETNDPSFVKKLALLGDLYINDAFSACHRAHASIVGLPKILPRLAGLSLEKEIHSLLRITEDPKRPLVVIIGGKKPAKIEKLKVFLGMADYVLINGFLSQYILATQGVFPKEGYFDKEIEKALEGVSLTDPRLHLPKDVLFSLENDWTYKRIGGLGTIRKEEEVFDIGPETIEIFSSIISKAETIFWAGPMGAFEMDRFKKGTREIGEKVIRNYKAFKIAGGGDTISAVRKFNWLDKFEHLSTGGSALLKFLSGERLPGIEVLD